MCGFWAIVLGCTLCAQAGSDIFSPDLELLRTAHSANLTRYPSGELRAILRVGQYSPVEVHKQHDCRVVWLDDKIWTRDESWEVKSRDENKMGVNPGHKLEWIIDRGKTIVYHPAGRDVIVSPRTSNELQLETMLVPGRTWYSLLGIEAYSWNAVLGNTRGGKTRTDGAIYEVDRLNDGQVKVQVSTNGTAMKAQSLFSWKYDGNLTRFESTDPELKTTDRCTCEWSRDDHGRVYLKRSIRDSEAFLRNTNVRTYKEIEILSFNPDYHVTPSLFTLDTLKLPGGVDIHDRVRGRVRRTGDAPIVKVSGELDTLIREMRSRGFSTRGAH
jgi:hypothetical protein